MVYLVYYTVQQPEILYHFEFYSLPQRPAGLTTKHKHLQSFKHPRNCHLGTRLTLASFVYILVYFIHLLLGKH